MDININTSSKVHINNIGSLKKYSMFRDLLEECNSVTSIPLRFVYPEIAKNYLQNNGNTTNIEDVNELIKYLQFAQFIGDNNCTNIAKKIVSNIDCDTVISIDLLPEVEDAIIKEISKISVLRYLVLKHKNIKNRIDFRELHTWDISKISTHRGLTAEFVEKYIDLNWNWSRLSINPLVTTPEFVEKYIDEPWDWKKLSRFMSVTSKFMENHSEKPWDWDGLSFNRKLTLEFIEKHIDKSWNWGQWGLSTNPIITSEFVEKHINMPWFWGQYGLSSNPSITPEFVEKHIDKPWDWYDLSHDSSITQKFIEKHIDKPWELGKYDIPSNPSMTLEFILKHIDLNKSRNWRDLSMNRMITLKFVEEHIDKPWNWGKWGLSINPNVSPDFIERHIDKSWNWGKDGLSSNPSITLEFIEKHMDKSWNWYYLTSNSNITLEFIERHIDKKWNWIKLMFIPYHFVFITNYIQYLKILELNERLTENKINYKNLLINPTLRYVEDSEFIKNHYQLEENKEYCDIIDKF